YQVSTDDGTTWNYWTGAAWSTTTQTDGTQTSVATEINANIATLDTDGGDFTWRAYLSSDGNQKVELDQIDITATVNDTPTLAASAANDSLTENTDTTSAAVFSTVTIDPIESGDYMALAQLTLGGGIENTDTLTINGTAITALGSDSSGAITGGHSYSYTQATGVVTITFAGSTNAPAAELVLENITYGIDASDQDPSTTARTVTLNTVTDNGGGADTNTDISETATISVIRTNDTPVVDDQSFLLDENSPNGTVVGMVSASDPDADDTLTYSITNGNAAGTFAIDSSSGQILVSDSSLLDFETNSTFNLTVQVEDGGALIDTATITIDLNDLFEDYVPIDPPDPDPILPEDPEDPVDPEDDSPPEEFEIDTTLIPEDTSDDSLPVPVILAPSNPGATNATIHDLWNMTSDQQDEGDFYGSRDVSVSLAFLGMEEEKDEGGPLLFTAEGFSETLQQEIDALVMELNLQNADMVHVQNLRIGTVTTFLGAVSIGYMAWILKGGFLVASLLAQMPAWRSFDPLPVLETAEMGKKHRRRHCDHEGDEQDEGEQQIKSILE
ncbi:MAG: hypothetical protein GY759_17615, partial [Chloroflexi bacterium]|nr:hypothetical protein [Chloroflexota bacterium]